MTLISCHLHDYVEAACILRYHVRVTLTDRDPVEGEAVDIVSDPEKGEYLIVDEGQHIQIELSQIEKLEVLTANAVFSKVFF